MDRIRIPKVEGVVFERCKQPIRGTLHLTSHHLIFSFNLHPTAHGHVRVNSASSPAAPKAKAEQREVWITYPMTQFCSFRPNTDKPSIHLRCRDFTFTTLYFESELQARDVFETIRSLSCNLGHIERLYAFSYTPRTPELQFNGWTVYDVRREMHRMGVREDGAWRISSFNKSYAKIETYPEYIVVPESVNDSTLLHALPHRSRNRIPALTYLHSNGCSLTRSSQPMSGLRRGKRNEQDEKLVYEGFSTTVQANQAPSDQASVADSASQAESTRPEPGPGLPADPDGAVDQALLSQIGLWEETADVEGLKGTKVLNLIADARPKLSAMANQAIGRGSENMENYPGAAKTYLGIGNIHTMRNSLLQVVMLLRDAERTGQPINRAQLGGTSWLRHLETLLAGTYTITRHIGVNGAHVLLHCSDGWDRTSQLSALSQICLSPFYRTFDGFMVLVEKDWLSFGHQFRLRSGLMGDERWFETDVDWKSGGGNGWSGNRIDNAFHLFKSFFGPKPSDSKESMVDIEDDFWDLGPGNGWWTEKGNESRPDDISPIFHQFLDGVFQLMSQYPARFEFNELFLRRLLYHVYSCQYGTFLFNCEKERRDAKATERTRSVWDYFLAQRAKFLSPSFDPALDEATRGGPVILPRRDRPLRWWCRLFGRREDEMNGAGPSRPTAGPSSSARAESADGDAGTRAGSLVSPDSGIARLRLSSSEVSNMPHVEGIGGVDRAGPATAGRADGGGAEKNGGMAPSKVGPTSECEGASATGSLNDRDWRVPSNSERKQSGGQAPPPTTPISPEGYAREPDESVDGPATQTKTADDGDDAAKAKTPLEKSLHEVGRPDQTLSPIPERRPLPSASIRPSSRHGRHGGRGGASK